MGLFDGQGMGNAPETLGDMYRGVGRGIGTGMIDPYMEGKGFTSKENQIFSIVFSPTINLCCAEIKSLPLDVSST